MIHPLLHLLVTQPRLLAGHAAAYAELVAKEVGAATVSRERKALITVAQLCCWTAATIFAGVALMLWSALPTVDKYALWALLGVPMLAMVAALVLRMASARVVMVSPFDNVRQQFTADIAMLREAGAL